MQIVYTKHAKNKFKYAEELRWDLREKNIKLALQNPDYHSIDKVKNVEISLKRFDERHNLRVIYTTRNGIITVITFYLTKKGRYEKK